MILEQDDGFFKPLEAGQKRYASLEILNPCYDSQDSQCIDCGNWYKELMQFNRFELDVKEAMVIEHYLLKLIFDLSPFSGGFKGTDRGD